VPFLEPNKYLAIFCAFLLGFGDSCFQTQVYEIIGALYPNASAPAFALFKFTQALASAVAFVYSLFLELHWQLLILVIFLSWATIFFFIADVDVKRKENERYSLINAEVEDYNEPEISCENASADMKDD